MVRRIAFSAILVLTLCLALAASVSHAVQTNYRLKLLLVAATQGNTAEVTRLLQLEIDPNAKPVLAGASASGHLNIVRLLVSHGARINDRQDGGSSALWAACAYRRGKVAQFLLAHGANPNTRNPDGDGVLLHLTVRHDDLEGTQALLAAGAQKTLRDQNGLTPLDVAICNRRTALIRLLR